MQPIENPPENTCYACGPANPQGLGIQPVLDHDDAGPFVRVTHTPREHETGWPGLLHTGLQYLVLFDASYWAALMHTDKVHTANGPQTYDQRRLPRTGVPFHVEARIIGESPLRTRAMALTHDDRPCATLEVNWRAQSRAQILRAGLDLPEYLLDHMEP